MSIKVQNHHPEYAEFLPDWNLIDDAYRGQRAVKAKGEIYLPPTASHRLDGYPRENTEGKNAYDAYRMRARYYNFLKEAISMAIGMMHSQPAEIKVPEAMKDIRSSRNETMENLLQRINFSQLKFGRIGLLSDLPSKGGGDLPYITTYEARSIINWDDGNKTIVPQTHNLIILDETEYQRQAGFSWEEKESFRVLSLGEPDSDNTVNDVYQQTLYDNASLEGGTKIIPTRLGKTLNRIPFTIVNACDLDSSVEEPPLMDLAELCMTIYRASADHRQNLFMQGQDTLVTIGGAFDEDSKVRTGAGARIDLQQGGDAKYIGVQSNGLIEQREDLNSLTSQAGSMGAQTMDTTSRERESGDSLRIRVAARTADLNQIVDAGALGLEDQLKLIAQWMGENPEEVSVTPNREFGEMPLTGQTMVEMATARSLGFPLSAKSMHDLARKRKMTSLTYEEEIAEAKKEDGEDGFPFKKSETGDRAGADQNAPRNGPADK